MSSIAEALRDPAPDLRAPGVAHTGADGTFALPLPAPGIVFRLFALADSGWAATDLARPGCPETRMERLHALLGNPASHEVYAIDSVSNALFAFNTPEFFVKPPATPSAGR